MGPALGKAIGIGTGLQVLMVVVGHLAPALQAMGLFPIAGTLIGGITGWIGAGGANGLGAKASTGAVAGGIAGALGSLECLDDRHHIKFHDVRHPAE
jgi:hypothetical protein